MPLARALPAPLVSPPGCQQPTTHAALAGPATVSSRHRNSELKAGIHPLRGRVRLGVGVGQQGDAGAGRGTERECGGEGEGEAVRDRERGSEAEEEGEVGGVEHETGGEQERVELREEAWFEIFPSHLIEPTVHAKQRLGESSEAEEDTTYPRFFGNNDVAVFGPSEVVDWY
ncbi:hypothetical protein ABZP36_024135 [Zizania latifolia]